MLRRVDGAWENGPTAEVVGGCHTGGLGVRWPQLAP